MNVIHLISGGGSLIQDVTSRRSLWYYLYNIRAAKRRKNRVMMYGCGIGPVIRPRHQRLAAEYMNRYVDAITLREPDSLQELRRMGVDQPEACLSADPALRLPMPSPTVLSSPTVCRWRGGTSALPCGIGRGWRRNLRPSGPGRSTPTSATA